MTELKLKKCPFCGGEANITDLDGTVRYGKRSWCVVCYECDLYFGYDLTYGGLYETKKGCAEDWNKRVGNNEECCCELVNKRFGE